MTDATTTAGTPTDETQPGESIVPFWMDGGDGARGVRRRTEAAGRVEEAHGAGGGREITVRGVRAEGVAAGGAEQAGVAAG